MRPTVLSTVAVCLGLLAPSLVAAGSAPAVGADGWRDAGRMMGPRDSLLVDGSISDVVVAVGTDGRSHERPRTVSTIARRTPDGEWSRAIRHLGDPVGVHVSSRGHAVIISVRNRAVVATTWPRRAARPVSSVVLARSDSPGRYVSTTSKANGRGDVAVLVNTWPGHPDRAVVLRKPAGRTWRAPVTVDAATTGALDDIDVLAGGGVAGVFKHHKTLRISMLWPHSGGFGPGFQMTRWAKVDDVPGSPRESGARIVARAGGGFATVWMVAESHGSSELITSRVTIVSGDSRRWQRDLSYADDSVVPYHVARDGAVLLRAGTVRRWDPESRRLKGHDTGHLTDANVRGDALLMSGLYRGRLRLWPLGKRVGPEVPAPRGMLRGAVLTNERRAYVVVSTGRDLGGAYRLQIRNF